MLVCNCCGCEEENKKNKGFKACGNLGVLKTAEAAGVRISLANRQFSKKMRTLSREKDLERTFIIIKKIPLKIIYYVMGWKLFKESGF